MKKRIRKQNFVPCSRREDWKKDRKKKVSRQRRMLIFAACVFTMFFFFFAFYNMTAEEAEEETEKSTEAGTENVSEAESTEKVVEEASAITQTRATTAQAPLKRLMWPGWFRPFRKLWWISIHRFKMRFPGPAILTIMC